MIARALAWLAGILAVLGGAFWAGRRNGKQETALEAAERYAKTRKVIDDEKASDDPGALRDWLRERPADKP